MRNKRKKHLKQLRLQISRMKRAMKRNSKNTSCVEDITLKIEKEELQQDEFGKAKTI